MTIFQSANTQPGPRFIIVVFQKVDPEDVSIAKKPSVHLKEKKVFQQKQTRELFCRRVLLQKKGICSRNKEEFINQKQPVHHHSIKRMLMRIAIFMFSRMHHHHHHHQQWNASSPSNGCAHFAAVLFCINYTTMLFFRTPLYKSVHISTFVTSKTCQIPPQSPDVRV